MNINEKWLHIYNLCKDYYNKYRNLDIPKDYKVNGISLYNWLKQQRTSYNAGRLNQEQINLLNEIEMIWDYAWYKWYKIYLIAKEYYDMYGNLKVPRWYQIYDVKLGIWISSQRINKENLSTKQTDLLDDIKMIWSVSNKRLSWDEAYAIAKKYYLKYGHLQVQQQEIFEGYKLGLWVHTQKKKERNNELSERKITLLNDLKIVWISDDKAYQNWMAVYKEISKICKVNNITIEEIEDPKKVKWVRTQKSAYKKKTLTKKQIKLLEDLKIDWHNEIEKKWLQKYEIAKVYYNTYGNLLVPSDSFEHKELYKWLTEQRVTYKKGILDQSRIDLLNEIYMIWDVRKYKMLNTKIDILNLKNKRKQLNNVLKETLEEFSNSDAFTNESLNDIRGDFINRVYR